MRRLAASLTLIALALALAGAPGAAATSIGSKYQLRGHLPELGERPTMRVFTTQVAYDAYRTSLGDANVFPPASSMFMSFDKDILGLYTRGNDTGGRCLATATSASLDGDTVSVDLSWQSGTCGAPITAHYPFILFSVSRTAADGSTWVAANRSVCAAAQAASDTRACAALSGASPAPTTAATSVPPTAPPTATPAPTGTRTLTPSASATSTVAAASPTPGSTSAQASAVPSRSPAAAASPAPSETDTGTNYLLYGMLIAIGVLIGIALMLSRSSSSRRGR